MNTMPEYAPVTCAGELRTLDSFDLQDGYTAGYHGRPYAHNRARGYQHGYLLGMVDAGRQPQTPELQQLWQSEIALLRPH